MGGYIAHHQVYTIFQGLPRQVPPDHMCHPWPISMVGPRAQNFALKSQISLPNKSLRTLWTFFPLRPIMGHGGGSEICWKKKSAENWGKIEILCPRIGCIFFTDSVFFCFSAELHYRNCVPDLCWKKTFSAELCIQTYGSAELNITKCVVDFCWFNGFPSDFCCFFFRRNSASQNVRLSSADLGFFLAEIHKSDDAWLPMIPCCMFISQC